MDDQAVGAVYRRLRIRLAWTQASLAARAGVAQATISRIERGHVARMSLETLRDVARELDMRLDVVPRWRGGELDRLLGHRHALMHEHIAAMLAARRWLVAPEVTFNQFGERGVIDILAWHPGRRALLIIELKTELVDVNDLLGTTDRRRRLAATIARERGWDPRVVGVWVVVADSRTNRRRVAAHRALLRAALPADGRTVAGWLALPSGTLSALSFLPSIHESTGRPGLTSVRRVRVGRASTGRDPDQAIHASGD